MKTKNIVRKLMLIPVLAGLALSSCVMESEEPQFPVTTDDATVTFSMSVPGNSNPATRGLGLTDETNVNTVDVLLFRLDNGSRVYYDRVPGVSLDNTAASLKSFTAVIPVKDYQNYDISIIANGRDVLAASGLAAGDAKDVALNKLIKTVNTGTIWNSNAIPMWGEAKNVTINESTVLSGNNAVKMTRMIARIDVKLADAAAGTNNANFSLTDVRLYNYSTRGTLVPELSAAGWDEGDAILPPFAKIPNAPSGGYGTALYNNGAVPPLVYTAANQHSSAQYLPDSLVRAIYTFEAPTGSPSTLASNVCLVIGGKYNNSQTDTYYRIDFARKNNTTKEYEYMPLKRNFQYTINITKITGEGFSSPDLAFNSRPVNIETDILDWNDGDMSDIVFDGTNFLSVSPGKFDFYKESGKGTITVATDVAVVNGKNWEAKLYEDEDGLNELTGTDRWFTLDKYQDAVVYSSATKNKSTVVMTVTENTGAAREGWIHIKADRLKYKIQVSQSALPKPEDYEIKITTEVNGNDVEVGELFFIGDNNAAKPGSKDFKVQWGPAGSLLGVSVLPDGTNPLITTYDPDLTAQSTLQWTDTGHSYTVDPAAMGTPPADEPFFEKSSRVFFTLQTPSGPKTKAISLRQTQFNLVPRPTTILMNEQPQTFRVLANFTWKVEFVSATADKPAFNDKIVKSFPTQFGSNNIINGDPVTFTCFDYISEYKDSNPKKAEVKMRFYRLLYEDVWDTDPFKEFDITCYAAVPGEPSNSYMMDWNEPVPVLIPVSQVSRAISSSASPAANSGLLPSTWLTDADFNDVAQPMRAQVLWSDIQDGTSGKALISGDGAVVRDVVLSGTSVDDAKVLVVPGQPYIASGVKGGNAVVILYKDMDNSGFYDSTSDLIKWSWHIWNTDYIPGGTYLNPLTKPTTNDKHTVTNGVIYKFGGNNNNVWMDRNIGAIGGNVKPSTGYNKEYELGFHYQWGRKDPLPGSNMSSATSTTDRTVYFHSSVPTTGSGTSKLTFQGIGSVNGLQSAVNYPQWHIFRNAEPYDWFATSKANQNNELWGQIHGVWTAAASTAQYVDQTTGKSVYDPCPEGWKVPKGQGTSAATYSPWALFTSQSITNGTGWVNDTSYGYWPVAGCRSSSSAALYGVGQYGYYWSSSPSSTAYGYSLYFGSGAVNPQGSGNRAYGFSARCVAE